MELTVFFTHHKIILCDTQHLIDTIEKNNIQFRPILINNENDIILFINNLEYQSYSNTILHHHNFESLKGLFFSQFQMIEAAGGIVQNQQNELLFIFRRGKWDLPKGKMELNETAELCASREIEEETGVTNLNLINPITTTYHIYEERGIRILKISHWFRFDTYFDSPTKPQIEEDITEIKWIPLNQINEYLNNSYENIKIVIDQYFHAMNFRN
jgi:ADP-ribose pyrophosphatase YjhB (NUDIX family)